MLSSDTAYLKTRFHAHEGVRMNLYKHSPCEIFISLKTPSSRSSCGSCMAPSWWLDCWCVVEVEVEIGNLLASEIAYTKNRKETWKSCFKHVCSEQRILYSQVKELLDPILHSYAWHRITSAWCKEYSVPIEKLFSKTLLTKCMYLQQFSSNIVLISRFQSPGQWKWNLTGNSELYLNLCISLFVGLLQENPNTSFSIIASSALRWLFLSFTSFFLGLSSLFGALCCCNTHYTYSEHKARSTSFLVIYIQKYLCS